MPNMKALDSNKKLAITYRVEGGCLGPVGHMHIDKFCDYAQENIKNKNDNFISLKIAPRHDKSLPEMQFNLLSKKITHDQAEKYLSFFNLSLENFEGELSDQLTQLIQTYVNKHINSFT